MKKIGFLRLYVLLLLVLNALNSIGASRNRQTIEQQKTELASWQEAASSVVARTGADTAQLSPTNLADVLNPCIPYRIDNPEHWQSEQSGCTPEGKPRQGATVVAQFLHEEDREVDLGRRTY